MIDRLFDRLWILCCRYLELIIDVVGICFTIAFAKVPSAVAFSLLLVTAVVRAKY